ncbi:hypothetical protein HOG98_03165 [bacterium]|nr:hypothetical protein [bacterium]
MNTKTCTCPWYQKTKYQIGT